MAELLTPEPIVSCRAFIENHGELLVVQRTDGVEQPGLWEFPGGKQDIGEDILTTALRETSEETGLSITPIREGLLVVDDYIIPDGKHAGRRLITYGILATATERRVRLTEHSQSSWERPAGLFSRQDLTRCMPAALEIVRQEFCII